MAVSTLRGRGAGGDRDLTEPISSGPAVGAGAGGEAAGGDAAGGGAAGGGAVRSLVPADGASTSTDTPSSTEAELRSSFFVVAIGIIPKIFAAGVGQSFGFLTSSEG
mmetsp:Transcript_161562/g.294937  ORF Transcript_161562/g.294937 Transcript_161562/m.294937 type:complete len:107 (+) Transcript_161562:385-705(+)